jgi:hypothetical protein
MRMSSVRMEARKWPRKATAHAVWLRCDVHSSSLSSVRKYERPALPA